VDLHSNVRVLLGITKGTETATGVP
jgi:hypothetical protein